MWTRLIVAVHNRGVKPPCVRVVFHTTSLLTEQPQFAIFCYQISTLTSRQDSKSSIRSRKEGTLQKIGEFLQSSPTLLGTKGQFAAQ